MTDTNGMREALQGFVDDLTNSLRNRETMLTINHDALRKRIDQAKAVLAIDRAARMGEEAAREYFERGFLSGFAWHLTKRADEQICDATLDHAWEHREEGGALPPLAADASGEAERLREALIWADLKIRSYPGADQSDVEFIRAVLDPTAGTSGDVPAGCICAVAFGQNRACPLHGDGTVWRAANPEADWREAEALRNAGG